MNGDRESIQDNFVDGRPCPPARGLYARHLDAGRLADSCAIDVQAATTAASRALPFWSGLNELERSGILRRCARRLITTSGEPQITATALQALRFPNHSELLTRDEQGVLLRLADAPPCVCRLLIPLGANPAVMMQRLVPLLVTGHVLVIGVLHNPKASETTRTLPALTGVGRCLPDGVINVVSGRAHNMGRALLESPHVRTRVILRVNPPLAQRCAMYTSVGRH